MGSLALFCSDLGPVGNYETECCRYEELPETSENDRNIWLCIPSLASEPYEEI